MILKYIIAFILGWITGSISIILLTLLRFGIPMCNKLIKNNEEDISALRLLRKKYFFSLIINSLLISIISIPCYIYLDTAFILFIIVIIVMILLGYTSTGATQNNLSEFNNSLKSNTVKKDISASKSEKDLIVNQLMQKSNLSEIICSDVYDILIDFKNSERILAYNKIENALIPHLKEEGQYGNVSVAFGMLIDDIGLSQDEALKLSQNVMKEMLQK